MPTFAGILLGRNAAAGSEASGTWTIGSLTSGSSNRNYLAGAFGVVRGADAARPTPDTDDGTIANASTFWCEAT